MQILIIFIGETAFPVRLCCPCGKRIGQGSGHANNFFLLLGLWIGEKSHAIKAPTWSLKISFARAPGATEHRWKWVDVGEKTARRPFSYQQDGVARWLDTLCQYITC
jgi:hypothetical protein